MRSTGWPVALAAACVLTLSAGSAPPRAGGEPPSDPGTLVLQLHLWESMTGPAERAELPEFSLYGGGRVIVGAGWDGSLLRGHEFTLDPRDYRQVYRLAHAAGLARPRHLREPATTTDGTLLVAELRAGERLRTTTAISLGRHDDTGQRLRLTELREELQRHVVAPARITAGEYRPDRVAVLTAGGLGASDPPVPRPWPYRDPAQGERTVLGLCTIHHGAEAAEIQELARITGQDSRWWNARTGTHDIAVLVRPLLPEEAGCADLGYPAQR
ncbi:hypothetical protein AB0F81_25625 [Actinoplanes sp. NPDC024001]|uniref:hypothetical protein n=1 Tax=Actinoplanes sp. NPDC024001 TaxID=3154598 RepID=UPI0033EF34B2